MVDDHGMAGQILVQKVFIQRTGTNVVRIDSLLDLLVLEVSSGDFSKLGEEQGPVDDGVAMLLSDP